MAMAAAERDELHALMEERFGSRGAHLLMSGLAAADLEAMEERLTLRIELVRSELHTDLAALDAKFETKFAGLEGKFAGLEGRFAGLETRFAGLETRFAGLETRFAGLEGKFGGLEGKVGGLRGELGEFRGEVGQEFGRLRGEIATQNRVLLFATVTAGIGIVGILIGIGGLIVTAVQLASA